MPGKPLRLGLMGFGQIGRQIYQLAAASEDLEIPVISDLGKPDILHYLLSSDTDGNPDFRLDGNHLVNQRFSSRMVQNASPGQTPWDVFDVDQAVRDAKAGKIEFRVDRAGNIQVPVGKRSFENEKIKANIMAFMDAVMRAKPAAAKGTYVRSITISSTMGPGIKIDRVAMLQSLVV